MRMIENLVIFPCSFLFNSAVFKSDIFLILTTILIWFQEFEIKETSEEYLALHPMGSSKKQTSLLDEHFEPVMSDDDQSLNDSDAPESSEDEPANTMNEKTRVPR